MPRISVVPKISIRKKPLAISGMITQDQRDQPGRGTVEFRPGAGDRRAAPRRRAGWLEAGRPGSTTCHRLASRPCGRSASTSTMIRKVTTIA